MVGIISSLPGALAFEFNSQLESSGLRDEIRYHYVHSGRPRTEALPYRLADGQWHRVALSVSASHLLLHIDCNRYVLAFDLL